jgi:hypothetical protein
VQTLEKAFKAKQSPASDAGQKMDFRSSLPEQVLKYGRYIVTRIMAHATWKDLQTIQDDLQLLIKLGVDLLPAVGVALVEAALTDVLKQTNNVYQSLPLEQKQSLFKSALYTDLLKERKAARWSQVTTDDTLHADVRVELIDALLQQVDNKDARDLLAFGSTVLNKNLTDYDKLTYMLGLGRKTLEKYLAQWPVVPKLFGNKPQLSLLPHLSPGEVVPAGADAGTLLVLFRWLMINKVDLPQGQARHCVDQIRKVEGLEPKGVWDSVITEYIHLRMGLSTWPKVGPVGQMATLTELSDEAKCVTTSLWKVWMLPLKKHNLADFPSLRWLEERSEQQLASRKRLEAEEEAKTLQAEQKREKSSDPYEDPAVSSSESKSELADTNNGDNAAACLETGDGSNATIGGKYKGHKKHKKYKKEKKEKKKNKDREDKEPKEEKQEAKEEPLVDHPLEVSVGSIFMLHAKKQADLYNDKEVQVVKVLKNDAWVTMLTGPACGEEKKVPLAYLRHRSGTKRALADMSSEDTGGLAQPMAPVAAAAQAEAPAPAATNVASDASPTIDQVYGDLIG